MKNGGQRGYGGHELEAVRDVVYKKIGLNLTSSMPENLYFDIHMSIFSIMLNI